MRRFLTGALVAVGLAGALTAQSPPAAPYDRFFGPGTMRVDYFHTGGPIGEAVALDRVVSDGPWAGSRSRLLDDTNLGKYLVEVIDRDSNRVIFSRGFASIYGEWETTAEVRTASRTFHESLRIPWPKAPVRIVLQKRDRDNVFRDFWSATVDPDSRFVNRSDRPPSGMVWSLFESGPAAEKVDLLLIGDGYTAAQLPKFHADVTRLVDALFALEPFRSRKSDFNVRGLDVASAEAGVSRPRAGVFRRTSLSVEYNIFDLERYMLTYDNRTLRDVASAAPYDVVEIVANEEQYGGGGIFNAQATVAVDNRFAEYVFVHEFAHNLAGLGDEYYTSDVTYETGAPEKPEPWEPNLTAMHNPAQLKWRDLVDRGTPLPTPWDKAAYETQAREFQAKRRQLQDSGMTESQIADALNDQQGWDTALLASMKYAGQVGAFEGAGYESRGLYRPELDCIMFTRSPAGFCRVCRRAIDRIIDLYSKP